MQDSSSQIKKTTSSPHLRRALTLPLIILYGLGTTIGAGIYVLVGATTAQAGIHAPVAFIIAAAVMLPSACSFSEFVGRLPVSAGEAAYVREGFGSQPLSVLVGLMVVAAGVVSSSTICVGSVGYIQHFVDLPAAVIIPAVVLLMCAISAWGIFESVVLAAILTVIEISGLLFLITFGFAANPALFAQIPMVFPGSFDFGIWSGIFGAALLAFFAFIGFEDLVNVAEETKRPERTLPLGIFITLGVSVVLYVLVASVAVLSVSLPALGEAKAPLSFVFEEITGTSPIVISAIAVVATLNGVIIQIIMASRIVYGLSRQGSLPSHLGAVNPVTRTPLLATILVSLTVLVLAALFPLEGLAEMTSRITLSVFTLVNLALLAIKFRGDPPPPGAFEVWTWVPVVGAVSCVLLILSDAF